MTERKRHTVTAAEDNVPRQGDVVLPGGLLAQVFGDDLARAWAERKARRQACDPATSK
ncbi:MAG: hypothetical protein AB7Q81_24460 [Gammaproteobacteria bacterium]